MTHQLPPSDQPRLGAHDSIGKVPALAAWGFYLLSIPSAALFVPVGAMVAYASRGSATGVARLHLDEQIRFFWSIIWWTVLLWVLMAISFVLSFVLIGLPFFFLFWGLLTVIHVWFTIRSAIGLIHLLGDRAP